MIIMSQDRTRIYNFERISEIVVSDTEICISDNLRQEEGLVIATYKTEERAKKILKDLILKYEAIELKKIDSTEKEGYTLSDYTPVYEMPKE